MIERLSMVRDNILIQLPPETETLTRNLDSGLEFHTVNAIKYHPTHGKLIQMSPQRFSHFEEDYIVFFGKQHWQNAKECAWGSEDERDKDLYAGYNCFAIKDGESYYLILPYSELYLAKFGGNLKPLNNHVLCEPIDKIKISELLFDDGSKEDYQINFARVVQSGNGLNEGDMVQTLKHCDLPLDEMLNNPVLSKNYFIIESENIISKLTDMGYVALNKRVIIKPIYAETQTAEGLTNFDTEYDKLQLAEVVSACEGGSCAVGDKIIYGKNSGILLPYKNGESRLLVINDADVFAIYK